MGGCGSNPGTVYWMDIFTFICCKNCNDVCLKRPKINEKEAGVGPFFFKKNKDIAWAETGQLKDVMQESDKLIFGQNCSSSNVEKKVVGLPFYLEDYQADYSRLSH